MEVEKRAENSAADPANRRAHPRVAVDEDSVVLFVSHGKPLECRVLDLSLEGCRVRATGRFPASLKSRVEVSFKVNGVAFRFCGVAQWSDGRQQAGIRFVDVPARRKGELAEVIAEVEAAAAAKAAKEAKERLEADGEAAEKAAREQAARDNTARDKAGASQRAALALVAPPVQETTPDSEPPRPAAAPPSNRDRRASARYEVDTSAAILLVRSGSRIEGRILDLSLNGCRIFTQERFPVGIYTRVETEFHLEGLPFRLSGVVQAIHDRRQVGIRFLDLSERKRREVLQLIEEIGEMRAKQDAPQE
ncbi:MAG: PilZ domain-containing protein [Terracidiphilus sp.]